MESNFKITAAHHYPKFSRKKLVKFLIQLHKKFNQDRLELLSARKMVATKIDVKVVLFFQNFQKKLQELR
jgi:malate synthase